MSVSNLKPRSTFTLPSSGRLLLPFDVEAAVRSLPVFCASPGMADILDNLVEFLVDGGYQIIMRACPSTQQQGGSNRILPNQTFEDQISIPTGSFLTMVGGIGFVADGGGAFTVVNTNFRTQWYDAGAQANLSDGYIHGSNISGNFLPNANVGQGMLTNVTANKNLFILPSPLSITSPGQLNVQITNLSGVVMVVDMTFIFATPVGNFNPVVGARVGNAVMR